MIDEMLASKDKWHKKHKCIRDILKKREIEQRELENNPANNL